MSFNNNWRRRNNPVGPERSSDSEQPNSSNAFGTRGRSAARGGGWTGSSRSVGRNQQQYSQSRPNFTSRGGRSINFGTRRNYPKSFNCVETLNELYHKNSSEIIMELIVKQESFSEFLESNLESDWIVLTVAILSKAFSSSFTENKITIINLAAKAVFIETLEKYIANLQYEETTARERNKYFWNNTDEFFVNLANVSEALIEIIPTKACEVLPKLLRVLNVSLPTLQELQSIEVSETTNSKIKNLTEKLNLCMEELVQKKRDNENRLTPPNDFRTLSVYPTCEEILSSDPAFVRKNIIEGRYNNVDHYLDVQFRLLKEDFVAPLRQGIAEYFDQSQGSKRYMKFSNVKIYPDVVLRSPIFEKDKVGVILNFLDKKARDRIFTARSKSFNYGSLVCFTKNNFESVLFGKVTDKDCKEQHLIIGFELECNNFELNVPYLMVECKVFFEPYYHVLKALQCMSEVDFPMKNYLIDVDSSVEPPGYFDEGSSIFTIHEQSVDLFGNNWPTADQCQLNLTQYSAFKAALTQKFVVIQGPPGTGKTYLGLQIVKTLLHEDNIKFWYNNTPILVVCFTNHALDQFLQGLISTTDKIVRVGGRSKCEELDRFNLRNTRKNYNINLEAMYFWKSEVERCLRQLKYFSEELKLLKSYNQIIHFNHFQVIDENITNSWFTRASSEDLLHWLLAERRHRDIKFNSNAIELSEIVEENIEDPPTQFESFREVDDMNILDDFDISSTKFLLKILASKQQMWTQIASIQTELKKMESSTEQETDFMLQWELETYLGDLWETYQYFKMRMRDGEISPPTMKPRNVNYHSPYRMHPNDRWNLYFYWLNLYQHSVVVQLVDLQKQYEEVHKKYTEIRNIIDTEVMKHKLVVGMTTSCAARLQTTLQTLKCRIVLVEEAAEVLESHVTVSLTNHCQHLILIGDHQQLRPTTADYRIEKKFNLGISMFERMVRNKIQCNMLGVQHRMRPEIANLIVPHIYPELENHYSVSSFPPILGVQYSLYFIHHEYEEFDEFDTKANLHEAKFLVNLACYLRQNGYQPDEITILAAYSGQFFALRDEIKKYGEFLAGVRICVLDNYQGEECKIILLSLVRNNREGKIGFLKIENRVCVALSRAREGLYIMGNINLLCDNSKIWPQIKEVLVKQDSLGNSLPLRCENHRDQITKIKEPKDFDKVAEGGCSRICGSLLTCGHNCSKPCHILDSEHRMYVCNAICSKVICENGHACRKMCNQACGSCTVTMKRRLECGHEQDLPCSLDPKTFRCDILVTATLACGHEVLNKPCYADVNRFNCTFKCDARIESCGHSCTFRCHINCDPEHLKERRCCKPCEKIAFGCTTNEHKCQELCADECLPCKVKVKRSLPNCSHMQDADCSADMSDVLCLKPCKKPLPCGHKCPRKCYKACGGCLELVLKTSDCGHEVKTKCSETPNRRDCRGACPKQLKCGHPCKNKCNEACTNECLELVEHANNAVCRHNFKVQCHMLTKKLPGNDIELLKFCREPCSKILECSHKCSGNCGQCFQGRLHVVCSEKCDITLICGHKCMSLCGDVCKPCELKCSFKCGHTICKKKCWEPCTQCKAPCARECKHTKCKTKCSAKCHVKPCEKPCDELLKCGHPCVGFCGEPCPPLCRLCDNEKLSEIVLGYEDEEDARFVLLDECKHVIESKGLQKYFQQGDTENGVLVGCKQCPRCKIPLASTQRYKKYIQETKKDIINLQRKDYGNNYERKGQYQKLIQKINDLSKKMHNNLRIRFRILGFSAQFLLDPLNKCIQVLTKQKQTFNFNIYKIIETKFSVLESIHEMNWTQLTSADTEILGKYLNYLLTFLGMENTKFTSQVIIDIERELCRLQRMKQIVEYPVRTSDSAYLSEMKEFILQPIPYTNDFDYQVKLKLEKLYSPRGLEVPNLECQAILKDLNLTKRRWYYCRNGHYYMDSSDPTQIAKCDQCWE